MTKIASQFSFVRIAFAFAVAAAALGQGAAGAWAQSDDSVTKDLDIRQVPMVEEIASAAPAASEGSADAAHGLQVSAALDRPDRLYKHGDSLVLTLETSEDAYVWVFDTGTSGKVHQIFPNRYAEDNFVRGGMPVAIPGADAKYDLAVSHPRGAELVTVIASRENVPPARNLIDDGVAAGPFLALRGTASSVAKDLSVSLREDHRAWATDHQVILIQ